MVMKQAIHQALAASMLEEGATAHRAYVYPEDLEKFDDGKHLAARIPTGHAIEIGVFFTPLTIANPAEELVESAPA